MWKQGVPDLVGGSHFPKTFPRSNKQFVQLLSEGARLPRADLFAIDSNHRHDFHTGVGQKTLAGVVQLCGSETAFLCWNVLFSCQLDHDRSSDAVQETALDGGCAQASVSDEEQIADGAFCQVLFPVQQDAVECPGSDGFPFGKNVVEKICGFDLGRKGAGQVPSCFGNDQRHAIPVQFGGGEMKRFGHNYDGGSAA